MRELRLQDKALLSMSYVNYTHVQLLGIMVIGCWPFKLHKVLDEDVH
jgi:hypothetical protein